MDPTTELSTVAPLSVGMRQAPSFVHQQLVALTQAPSYRTLLRRSNLLMSQGQDGRLALNALRPCADSPSETIRAMATLLRDEWKLMDDTVTTAYQEELTAVTDLLGRGLRLNIANPFGTTVIESQQVGEMTPAHVNMYAGTPPDNDRVEYTLVGVPVPIISKGFWLDERVLEAGRGRGQTLDTTNADAATRVVAEKLEDLLFNGGVAYGGYTLYGYTNHPHRNTGTLTGAWTTLATTNPAGIINDILAMLAAAYADNVTGQFMLYIPFTWFVALNGDYFLTAGTLGQTILQRIMAIPGIAGVRPVRQLTTSVVMVDLNRRTVDVGFGFEPRLIQWESQGGMVNHFRVISIMTFRIKSDAGLRSGIAHFS
jgi:hypothetical protein